MQELANIDEPSQAIVLYKITPSQIAKQLKEYDHLTVIEADTKSYKQVRTALTAIVATRVEVDKRRKKLGEDARKLVSNINQASKMLIEPMIPYEDRFKSELKAEDDRKAAIKAEKEAQEKERMEGIRVKISEIQAIGNGLPIMSLKDLRELANKLEELEINTDEYMEFADEATKVLNDTCYSVQGSIAITIQMEKEKAERKAEAERLEIQRKEQAKAQAKIDEENWKIQEEKDKLEADKKAEKERGEREEFERQAKLRAETYAKEKAEQAERECLEKETAEAEEKARQEALRPDREKLIKFANELLDRIGIPYVKSVKAKKILSEASNKLDELVTYIKEQAEKL